jgi:hypothetical protein
MSDKEMPKTIDVYAYHPTTKEYIGMDVADKSPLEYDTYLLPANTTRIAPPKVKENEVAVFDKATQKWYIKPDFRGIQGFNKYTREPITLIDIGEKPEYFTEEEPPLTEEERDRIEKDIALKEYYELREQVLDRMVEIELNITPTLSTKEYKNVISEIKAKKEKINTLIQKAEVKTKE